ncbi:sensor histidine kinase [Streptomyces sp. WZ-12]|uniref:sensor histidine kinase n=1 Tax=Streptomyces sp. WZ-12 TaxID=3030210 RepID=UPI0023810338|nr:nitrate- and nitrite sensing domain-containing protein [Streptomyces sp. WZ-12]
MAIVLVLPAALAVSLAVPRITESLDRVGQLNHNENTIRLVVSATTLAHALENERDVAALTPGEVGAAVREHRAATDQAWDAFRDSARKAGGGDRLQQRLDEVESELRGLAGVRARAFTDALGTVASQTAYSGLILPLLSLVTEANPGDDAHATQGWALYALAVGKLALSSERALLNAALADGRTEPDVATALLASQGIQEMALREFRANAVTQDAQHYERVAPGLAEAGRLAKAAAADAQRGTGGAEQKTGAKAWHRSATQALDGLRSVESEVTQRMLDSNAALRDQAGEDAVRDTVYVAVALGLALLVTAVAAHSVVSRLRRLRRAALQAAEHRLPALVEAVSRQAPGQVDLKATPVDLGTRDEVGDVSRAFDAVLHEAVRQAADQATLRQSVKAVLTSLGRRNQGLVYRQLEVITELENTEQNPARLAGLFQIDHLATRMRRHGENLLLLTDESPARVHAVPAPLLDVVRAGAAEVEHYTRVRMGQLPDLWVSGPAVHDVSHLLAELLENATRYSDPAEPVQVKAELGAEGGVVLWISDRGAGMSASTVAELNARLGDPPLIDVATTGQMGLYVVSRLAARLGIDVELSCPGEGCTVAVELPAVLLVAPEPYGRPAGC